MQFVLTLPESSNLPVYKQVSEALRQAILTGRLKPGDKLPSTRDLAESARVSRFTVIRSYEELASQGYIQTISGSGTFVNREIPKEFSEFAGYGEDPQQHPFLANEVELSEYGRRCLSGEIEHAEVELFPELNYGGPTQDQLPLNRWREVVNRSARFQDQALLSYSSDPFGYAPLREAIAGYLIRSRSVRCIPDQIAIFCGAQAALDLVCRMLLRPGDNAIVENPGFPGARRSLLMNGADLVPVSVDQHGLNVERLYHLESNARLCYVTPSHHDPTGVVMSLPRRLELLRWAERSHAFIVEDDYDSEFRYGDKPVPSLQGLDDHDQVIYLSTFWKVLFPVVRLAFLVVPKRLVEPFHRAKSLLDRDFPLLEQRALTDFINEGHLERHIRRTRAMYARRRAALVQALTKNFRKRVAISDVSAGMHLVVNFPQEVSHEHIMTAARNAQVPLVSSHGHYHQGEGKLGEYLVGFAHADEEQIHSAIERFATELSALSGNIAVTAS
ncbi:MAG TPA: PLP-dependent aminotransferase family protein [Planktothrix sp.]|jgi:GntR family transcriptional regulator/MocR family aminotransferase